jgi:hypothetical protein
MSKRAAVALTIISSLVFTASASAEQIEITARLQHTNHVALPPPGRGGDAESALWIVRDRHGNVIGDMLVDCRWVTRGLRLCVGQLSLPLGAIALIGASRTRFVGQLAVVGGTGRYVGAAGTLLFKATGLTRYVLSISYRKDSQ